LRSLVALLCVASLLGCSSPAPQPATDDELAPVDQPANPGQLVLEPPKPAPQKTGAPVDPDQGPIATIIYVTEIRNRDGSKRPGAVIFSSDPDSPYLQERPRPSRILKPVVGGERAHLFGELRTTGLERLPAEPQLPDEAITPDRQIIVIHDGKRVTYRQNNVRTNADAFKLFSACEKVVVDFSHDQDPYVQTMGRERTDDFKPLNPDR
jgi:hypothetical protein